MQHFLIDFNSENPKLGYHASPRATEQRVSGCRHSCAEILRDTLSASYWALTDADAYTCIAGSIMLW